MKIDGITLKNGESFNLLFPVTKLRFLKAKNIEYYKILNDFLNNPKKQHAIEDYFAIIYCSYLVNAGGTLTFDEFINNYPEEYDNLNDLGYLCASVIRKNNGKFNK